MTQPIALGRPSSPPSPPSERDSRSAFKHAMLEREMEWGDNAMTAPVTPSHQLPVIDKSKVDPQTLQAAQGMEAMFLDYMMKTMRQTVPKNEMDLESPASEIYRGMMDSETAQKAARAGGIGLADQIVAYLQAQRYTLEKGHHAPAAAHGVEQPPSPVQEVPHAGQSIR